jgi:hypothetical protein
VALLIIQTDNSTSDARDWLAELVDNILDRLDLEECVGAVNGDKMAEEIGRQIGYMAPRDIDELFEAAIESLLE